VKSKNRITKCPESHLNHLTFSILYNFLSFPLSCFPINFASDELPSMNVLLIETKVDWGCLLNSLSQSFFPIFFKKVFCYWDSRALFLVSTFSGFLCSYFSFFLSSFISFNLPFTISLLSHSLSFSLSLLVPSFSFEWCDVGEAGVNFINVIRTKYVFFVRTSFRQLFF